MSKFWAVQDSSDSENESLPEQQVNKQAPSGGGGRFAGAYSESDSGKYK